MGMFAAIMLVRFVGRVVIVVDRVVEETPGRIDGGAGRRSGVGGGPFLVMFVSSGAMIVSLFPLVHVGIRFTRIAAPRREKCKEQKGSPE